MMKKEKKKPRCPKTAFGWGPSPDPELRSPLLDKRSDREESELGSLFRFAGQVRFFERRGRQAPTAGSSVKTNYGGVKRRAQWGTAKTS